MLEWLPRLEVAQLLRLPLTQGLLDSDKNVSIPALRLGATNQLRFDFDYTTLLASGVPILDGEHDELLGVLNFNRLAPQPSFNEADLAKAEGFASSVGLALENAAVVRMNHGGMPAHDRTGRVQDDEVVGPLRGDRGDVTRQGGFDVVLVERFNRAQVFFEGRSGRH